jgi:hypothetical protein
MDAGRQLSVRRDERVDGRRVAVPVGQNMNEAAGPQIGFDVDPGLEDETAA